MAFDPRFDYLDADLVVHRGRPAGSRSAGVPRGNSARPAPAGDGASPALAAFRRGREWLAWSRSDREAFLRAAGAAATPADIERGKAAVAAAAESTLASWSHAERERAIALVRRSGGDALGAVGLLLEGRPSARPGTPPRRR